MRQRRDSPEKSVAPPRGAGSRGGRRIPKRSRRWFIVLTVAALVVVTVLWFGDDFLVVDEPLPEHADVAIVLAGSETTNAARIAGAMNLLEEGRVARVMLSVGAVTYYGEWLPDLVRRFVNREYGGRFDEQILVCEVYADSTAAELTDIAECLRGKQWKTAVIVTSNFHTRRTRMTLRSNLAGKTSVESFTVYGIADGSFERDGWWRHRIYSKTWLLETMKVLWFLIERAVPGGDV
jgi:uncharacterized SAM-binding protein YcdF (DUF218 family)